MDVRRISGPKTYSLGCFFTPDPTRVKSIFSKGDHRALTTAGETVSQAGGGFRTVLGDGSYGMPCTWAKWDRFVVFRVLRLLACGDTALTS